MRYRVYSVTDAVDAEDDRMQEVKDNQLAKVIADLRAELGLTQEQFAAKVGVTWSTVSRWENNRGKPSPLAMRQIDELRRLVSKPRRPV